MKLELSLSEVDTTIANLQKAGFVIQSSFADQLVEAGKKLKDRAKEILDDKVNPIYSTGRLRDSIELNFGERTDAWSGIKSLNITVGPDMRIAPYAEWVEFGHYMTGGWRAKGNIKGARWWEGHHYMEGAWLEISPEITKQIADTLKVKLNDFDRSVKRTRHRTTGHFVAGYGGKG